jgi:LmbE family N-acetylglucosaminyl deacetylase
VALLPSHPSDRAARRRAVSLEVPVIDRDRIEQVPPPASCLVVVAHPDDDCFGCSGTTAKWVAAGTAVDLVVATDGSKGSHDLTIPAADVAARREREQRASAEVLGYRDVHFLRYPDGELVACEEAVRGVVELIRQLCPEVVIGHDPWRLYQLHPDHRAVGEIVRDAVWRAGEPRFYEAPAWKPAELWLFHAEQPNHVEDVSEWMGAKWEALMRHESQFSSAFRFEENDSGGQAQFEQWFTRRFALVGQAAGFAYGEAFRRIFV